MFDRVDYFIMQSRKLSNILGDVREFCNMQQKSDDVDYALFIDQSGLLNWRLRSMLVGTHNRNV